jgi:hypothetical protein
MTMTWLGANGAEVRILNQLQYATRPVVAVLSELRQPGRDRIHAKE